MKLTESFYTIGQLMTIVADKIAPIPHEDAEVRPNGFCFPPNGYDAKAAISAIWFAGQSIFPPNRQLGPFVPVAKRLDRWPPQIPGARLARSLGAIGALRHQK